MFHIGHKKSLALGVVTFILLTAAVGAQDSAVPGIYFPPSGQSIANQNIRRPEEVGMRLEIVTVE